MVSLQECVVGEIEQWGEQVLQVPGRTNAEILKALRRAEPVYRLRPEDGICLDGACGWLPWPLWVEWEMPEIGPEGRYGWLIVPEGDRMVSYPYWSIEDVPAQSPNASVLAELDGFGGVLIGFEALDPEADKVWLVECWKTAYAMALRYERNRPNLKWVFG